MDSSAPPSPHVELPAELPILPLNGRVLLPSSVMRLVLSRPAMIALIESSLLPLLSGSERLVGVVPLVPADGGEAGSKGNGAQPTLHNVGTAARVLQLSRTEVPSLSYTLLLEGRCRFARGESVSEKPFLLSKVEQLDLRKPDVAAATSDRELQELASSFRASAQEMVEQLEGRRSSRLKLKALLESAPAHRLADLFVAAFEERFDKRLELLDNVCPKARLKQALALLESQMQGAVVSLDIARKVEGRMSKSQREYVLRQQLQAIRDELGDGAPPEEDELGTLEKRLSGAALPGEVRRLAESELKKLRRMGEQQPGYASGRSWVEWIVDLPWSKESQETEVGTMAEARATLEKQHYGLQKVKERIVEYVAVRRLRPKARPPILCFSGPPGVGKTSLATSVATVLGRPFHRISLGGVRDEAEIRGHRRTYISSMPGRVLQAVRRAGVRDPLLLLDEIDKMGMDGTRGDPAAALLEVLDPEQNDKFVDHYMNVPFDLSRVIFLATANNLAAIPPPLLDRLEVIEVGGYTYDEKLHIGMNHLVPRLLREHGLYEPRLFHIPEDVAKVVIEGYTREAGVRGLDRAIASLCRAAAVQIASHAPMEQQSPPTAQIESAPAPAEGAELLHDPHALALPNNPIQATVPMVEKVLGPRRFDRENELAERVSSPGVVAGLVWTSVGGDVMHVEATRMEGKGNLVTTGKLGAVIKESVSIALSWVRAHALQLGLDGKDISLHDIHVHFPQGAVPKDGPSAGITICTAIVSLFSGRRARSDTAMTGEMTLSGLVLPIGGVKEKIIAAHRLGFTRVLVPARNLPDVEADVPAKVRAGMEIIPVSRMPDVLTHALEGGFSGGALAGSVTDGVTNGSPSDVIDAVLTGLSRL
mmetsp:Transcript_29064/g.94897  ORF Transcript_29064/g.94897 Transcript_29064/m.94897 type:complete len:877 (+) Transcript_29064:1163-3793(+)